MDWLIATINMGIATAVATTFDDNIYLTAFFSEVDRTFRPKHVVVGEFLGFTVLMIVSLIGFVLGLVIPSTWTGLLGILPILIGINNLRTLNRDDSVEDRQVRSKRGSKFHGFESRKLSLWDVIRDRQTYRVSAVTIA